MINDFFEKVFLINLESRPDRLEIADCTLKEQGIEYERFPAIKDDNGVRGLLLTMRELFRTCIERNYKKGVLVLEDDFEFLLPANNFIDAIINQLPQDYLTFHFGVNLLSVPKRISTNILQIDQSYSTHAVVYSPAAIKMLFPLLENNETLAYDIMLRDTIQIYGKSYCTFPMLCVQRPDYSDIEYRFIDWKTLCISSFNRMTKNLNFMATEIVECIGGHKINRQDIIVDPLKFEIQHPELIGQKCDCKKFIYGEDMCGCAIKEWRVSWKENTNF